MSTTDNFVHELVAMAKAMETLPHVQADLDAARRELEVKAEQIQRLEMRLMDRNSEIENLNRDKHSLEVARDDAELRFLEADDRTDKALAFVRQVMGNAQSLIQAVEPPKPEPEPEPTPVEEPKDEPTTQPEAAQGHGEYVPSYDPGPAIGREFTLVDTKVRASEVPAPVDPTASGWQSDSGNTVPSSGASTIENVSQLTSTERSSIVEADVTSQPESFIGRPYAGKKYHDHPSYISRNDWLAGGGTEADYDWRPSWAS